MSEEIIKVLDALSEKAGVAINWTSDNIVPYLQRASSNLVKYEIISSIVWIIIALIGVIIIAKTFRLINPNNNSALNWTDFVLAGLTILCIICFIVQFLDIIRCIVFPEKVIIDTIMSTYTYYK